MTREDRVYFTLHQNDHQIALIDYVRKLQPDLKEVPISDVHIVYPDSNHIGVNFVVNKKD